MIQSCIIVSLELNNGTFCYNYIYIYPLEIILSVSLTWHFLCILCVLLYHKKVFALLMCTSLS